MIKLGSKVKDTITGVSGIAVARTEWLYGCARIGIEQEGLDKDGKQHNEGNPFWFDEQRVEIIKEQKPKVSKDSSAKSGGPQKDPSRRNL